MRCAVLALMLSVLAPAASAADWTDLLRNGLDDLDGPGGGALAPALGRSGDRLLQPRPAGRARGDGIH